MKILYNESSAKIMIHKGIKMWVIRDVKRKKGKGGLYKSTFMDS